MYIRLCGRVYGYDIEKNENDEYVAVGDPKLIGNFKKPLIIDATNQIVARRYYDVEVFGHEILGDKYGVITGKQGYFFQVILLFLAEQLKKLLYMDLAESLFHIIRTVYLKGVRIFILMAVSHLKLINLLKNQLKKTPIGWTPILSIIMIVSTN